MLVNAMQGSSLTAVWKQKEPAYCASNSKVSWVYRGMFNLNQTKRLNSPITFTVILENFKMLDLIIYILFNTCSNFDFGAVQSFGCLLFSKVILTEVSGTYSLVIVHNAPALKGLLKKKKKLGIHWVRPGFSVTSPFKTSELQSPGLHLPQAWFILCNYRWPHNLWRAILSSSV